MNFSDSMNVTGSSTTISQEELLPLVSQLKAENLAMQSQIEKINKKLTAVMERQRIAEVLSKPYWNSLFTPKVHQPKAITAEIKERAEMETVRKIVWISVAMLQTIPLICGIIFIAAGAPIWPIAVFMAALMLGGLAFDPLFRQWLKQGLCDCLASCGLSGQLETPAK